MALRRWGCVVLLLGRVTLVVGQEQVRLSEITILDEFGKSKPVALSTTVLLQARENYLTFHFSATRPTPIRYQLAGLDNDWRQCLSTAQLHYANLPGGNYIFQLQDPSTGHIQHLSIRIDAPFWLRWWFIPTLLLYLIGVVVLVGYLFLQYRFRQKLHALQARDRIARDLHDDMGSYLSSISILSQTAHRNALRNPEKTQLALTSIGQTARQVIERMGDMVWSINPSHDSMADVISRMTDVGNTLFGDTDVVFDFAVADGIRTLPVSAEVRREFFLIYKEALTNVARYAGASRVRVAVTTEGNGLSLTVQDNGCGFDPDRPTYKNPGGGNGLRNMQTRANLVGGTLTLHSAPGEGTTVRLVVAGISSI